MSKAIDQSNVTNLELHELELAALSKIRLFIKIPFESKVAVTVFNTSLDLVNVSSCLFN